MFELLIVLHSHYFKATRFQGRGREVVVEFARKNIQFSFQRNQWGKFEWLPSRVYAASNEARTEFRFHINQLKAFKEHCDIYKLPQEAIEYVAQPMFPVRTVDFKFKPGWVDKDYQVAVIDYLSQPLPISKFVNLQTGLGKSYCAMRAMERKRVVTAFFIRPKYIDKWLLDLAGAYELEDGDVMVIQGSTHLMKLTQLAIANELEAKVILISNKTLQSWIKLYERVGVEVLDLGYACLPEQLLEALQAGERVIDEVHQDFHLNFKLDLYSHVSSSIALSATLLSDDLFTNRMYDVAYPHPDRFVGLPYIKYIASFAIMYRFNNPDKVRFTEFGSKNYSHHAFEKSVMRQEKVKLNYFAMLNDLMAKTFLADFIPTRKCMLFCASIAMCTELVDYLKDKNPKFDIRRYVEDDPYENLMEPDIRVSTMLSAGTAVDIPNLTVVIMSTAMKSSQGNVQGFGRLRKLKDGRTPQFLYLVCEDIPKHVEYHAQKKELLADKALTYRPEYIGRKL